MALWILIFHQQSKFPTSSLVVIGLKKVDIMFFIYHVTSLDQVIKGSYDFLVGSPFVGTTCGSGDITF